MADHDTNHFQHDDSSSSSDSSDDNKSPLVAGNIKSKVYRLFGRDMPVHKVLGSGKTANILLWRDRKTSGMVLCGGSLLWLFFEMKEYHLITLVCHILILSLAALFLWSNVSIFFSRSPPKFPEMVLPEKSVIQFASALTIEINRALVAFRDIASGRSVKKFLRVVGVLWLISVVGSWCNFLTLVYILFLLMFTLPPLYEKYDEQVDAYAEKALIQIKKHYAVLEAKYLSKLPSGTLKMD